MNPSALCPLQPSERYVFFDADPVDDTKKKRKAASSSAAAAATKEDDEPKGDKAPRGPKKAAKGRKK